tara:strand:+ start:656 stop:886 length:231 start_codon:yes stop_codon:yes gene_type:complete
MSKMISEKKFDLEVSKRNNIIAQLRKDRNNMIIKYQALNESFVKVFDELNNIHQKISNKDLEDKINELKIKFKDHF